VRILDAGGWTDTWFAGHGLVCHLAAGPGVEVQAAMAGRRTAGDVGVVDLVVGVHGDRYRFERHRRPGRHPLLEATIVRWAPPGCDLNIEVRSTVPPGSGVGTSASVVVALVGALSVLRGEPLDAAAVAVAAHEIETVDVGLESGVQDQLAASFGGASLVTIDPYPNAHVVPLTLEEATWEALRRRLITVYLGRPHLSTAVHEAVIARLRELDERELLLEPLRQAARDAAAALVVGDLDSYGAAMAANTEAQAALHPGLVSLDARGVIALAAEHGAAGWKVNGAGGNGGSVSIVGPEDPTALAAAVVTTAGLVLLGLSPDRVGLRLEPASANR
jgi:D-glycero-alpha-D-manno-heptose-7-phosphate kinase